MGYYRIQRIREFILGDYTRLHRKPSANKGNWETKGPKNLNKGLGNWKFTKNTWQIWGHGATKSGYKSKLKIESVFTTTYKWLENMYTRKVM